MVYVYRISAFSSSFRAELREDPRRGAILLFAEFLADLLDIPP